MLRPMQGEMTTFPMTQCLYDDNIECMNTDKKTAGAIVLGMHDALVSLTGMIGGMTLAFADRKFIVLSAIIASVAAGLSMGVSNYLAEKTDGNLYAAYAGMMTGVAYMGTCSVLIAPFLIVENVRVALFLSMAMAVVIIIGCNWCIGHARGHRWWRHAIEMLVICAGVTAITFIIGEIANAWLGNHFMA